MKFKLYAYRVSRLQLFLSTIFYI